MEFKLTVGAAAEIAEFCPEKDISRIGEVMNNFADTVKNGARFIRALNRGYVISEKAKDPTASKGLKVVSEEEILALDPDEFMALLDDAMKCFGADKETSVEVEPVKKEKAPAGEEAR